MDRVLCGIETEYGLAISGRGPKDQVDDSAELVRSLPIPHFAGWDYRFESPRADLRGFSVQQLAVDPTDMQFEVGKSHAPPHIVRSDRVLTNGARFYNDHGHPEYSTPEAWSAHQAARLDREGERVTWQAAQAFAERTGFELRVFKNNTDFHGASYGTHESYLVPRSLGFDALFEGLAPILVCRTLLCGAGKVGSEIGERVAFQLSQRADFLTEPFNVETLYRRPLFNTRDEPHAEPGQWIRLHVISGDANRMVGCTARKMMLVSLAVRLLQIGELPRWSLSDPIRAFRAVSTDTTWAFDLDLHGRERASAYVILETLFQAAERRLQLSTEEHEEIELSRQLLEHISRGETDALVPHLDWAAKRWLAQLYAEENELGAFDPALQAIDLEYAEVSPEGGLFESLEASGDVVAPREAPAIEPLTRAAARGLAVERFRDCLRSASWGSLTFDLAGQPKTVALRPDIEYPEDLMRLESLEKFVECLEALNEDGKR